MADLPPRQKNSRIVAAHIRLVEHDCRPGHAALAAALRHLQERLSAESVTTWDLLRLWVCLHRAADVATRNLLPVEVAHG